MNPRKQVLNQAKKYSNNFMNCHTQPHQIKPVNSKSTSISSSNNDSTLTTKIYLEKMSNKIIDLQIHLLEQKEKNCGCPFNVASIKEGKLKYYEDALNQSIEEKQKNLYLIQGNIDKTKKEFEEQSLIKMQLEKKISEKENTNNQLLQKDRIAIIKGEEEIKAYSDQIKKVHHEMNDYKKKKIDEIHIVEQELDEYMSEVRKLTQEKNKVENNLESIRRENSKLIDSAIKPIQETYNQIIEQTEEVQNHLIQINHEIKNTKEELSMLGEDFNSHLIHRAEFVSRREEIENTLRGMIYKQGEDFNVFEEMRQNCNWSKESLYSRNKTIRFYLYFLSVFASKLMSAKNFCNVSSQINDFRTRLINENDSCDQIEERLMRIIKLSGVNISLEEVKMVREKYILQRDSEIMLTYIQKKEMDENLNKVDVSIRINMNIVESLIFQAMNASEKIIL